MLLRHEVSTLLDHFHSPVVTLRVGVSGVIMFWSSGTRKPLFSLLRRCPFIHLTTASATPRRSKSALFAS